MPGRPARSTGAVVHGQRQQRRRRSLPGPPPAGRGRSAAGAAYPSVIALPWRDGATRASLPCLRRTFRPAAPARCPPQQSRRPLLGVRGRVGVAAFPRSGGRPAGHGLHRRTARLFGRTHPADQHLPRPCLPSRSGRAFRSGCDHGTPLPHSRQSPRHSDLSSRQTRPLSAGSTGVHRYAPCPEHRDSPVRPASACPFFPSAGPFLRCPVPARAAFGIQERLRPHADPGRRAGPQRSGASGRPRGVADRSRAGQRRRPEGHGRGDQKWLARHHAPLSGRGIGLAHASARIPETTGPTLHGSGCRPRPGAHSARRRIAGIAAGAAPPTTHSMGRRRPLCDPESQRGFEKPFMPWAARRNYWSSFPPRMC